MTRAQTQRVRRQLRAAFRRDFIAFLKALTPSDMDNIIARVIADRQAQARQEV